MNATQHTLLARALIDACGGVDACCKPVTRVERSQLYAYRDFNSGVFMPADIIEQLESRCENPVYSAFLFHSRPAKTPAARLEAVGFLIGEGGVAIQRAIRLAAEDGELSDNEKRGIEEMCLEHEDLLRQARASMETGAAS
ncbi:hypothetical protein [Brevundimonas sp. UBA7664]|uniref:hypothetical protein n=1 Tax=Brevundimonas sp. UBA7664 TaxID=1946141 RepID=UPI0025BF1D17|nr:hypothetical protein [Brevundimonas sp. UBA7664]